MNILLIENYQPLVRALLRGLQEEGFSVEVAAPDTDADVCARSGRYAVIILGLLRSPASCLELLRPGRHEGQRSHILALTPSECSVPGADDSLQVPFALDELVSRLRAAVAMQQAP